MLKSNTEQCHVCKSCDLTLIQGAEGLSGVTSDCKVWEEINKLALCNKCGISQTITDEKWFQDTREIYENYEIYHQGDSCDHFIIKDGKNTRRSNILVDELIQKELVGKSGTMLEIGPGGGNLLKVWNESLPAWRLYAADVNDKAKESILSLNGVKDFYSCNIEDIPHKFDVVVSVHSLEHIPHPYDYLINLKKIIKPGGYLLINVPNCNENPFIITVADHCTHFVPYTLSNLLTASGFDILSLSTSCLNKEIVLVAQNNSNKKSFKDNLGQARPCGMLSSHLRWLNEIIKKINKLPGDMKLGCLGTSIAGTWLRAQIGQRLEFFVDEDESRQGKKHFGLPILSPSVLDKDAYVFLTFPYPVALEISKRFAAQDFQCILPPKSYDP
jgi:2-polyprenyl-3-methyl-5-hydroxy-6-metoxy-1,4-benzoquinol methylase